MNDSTNYKDACGASVICSDIIRLADMGENFDQLGPEEHGAVFASIGALTERVQALCEAIELRSNREECIQDEAAQ